jgi:hypothetical protein
MSVLGATALSMQPVSLGDTFEIQDSLPFDGRVVTAQLEESGVRLTESIDEDTETIFLSVAEITTLFYRLLDRQK